MADNLMAFTPGLTDTQLRATAVPVSGSVTATISGTVTTTGGLTDTQLRASAVPVSIATMPSTPVTGTFWQATQPISAASLPLPTGAALDASVTALSAKFGALGQTTMAGSAPVVIASNQSAIPVTLTSTTITGSVAVTGAFYQATQPVSLASTTITGSVAVTGPLTDTQLRASAVPVSLASTTVTGSVAVTGPLTDTQLRAAVVPVSLASTTITGTVAATQSGTWNIGSITTLPALVAGAAIIGKVGIDQTTPGTTNLVSIGTNGTVAINAALPAGAAIIGALVANQSVNTAQIAGVATATGNGVVGTGVQRVAIASDNSAVFTGTVDTSGTGSLTALDQAVTLSSLQGKTSGLIQLSGSWTGAVQLEGSNDGFVTTTKLATTQSFGAAPNTNPLTANGDYRVLGIINYASVRVRCSTFTSGTIVAFLKVSDANGIQPVISTNAAGFLTTATLSGVNTYDGAAKTVNFDQNDLLSQILTELKVVSTMLQIGLSVRDDLDNLREDYARTLN